MFFVVYFYVYILVFLLYGYVNFFSYLDVEYCFLYVINEEVDIILC